MQPYYRVGNLYIWLSCEGWIIYDPDTGETKRADDWMSDLDTVRQCEFCQTVVRTLYLNETDERWLCPECFGGPTWLASHKDTKDYTEDMIYGGSTNEV